MDARPILAALVLLGPAAAAASGGETLGLQAVFRNQAGLVIVAGSYDLRLSLHTAPQAGPGDAEVYAEQHLGVPIVDGVVSVALGEKAALDPAIFSKHGALWLEAKIATEPPLPRVPLRSVAWALHALRAGKAAALECTGCVGALHVDKALLDPASHPYAATISDVTVTNVAQALDQLRSGLQVVAASVTEITGGEGGGSLPVLSGAVAALKDEAAALGAAVEGLQAELGGVAGQVAAQGQQLQATQAQATAQGTAIQALQTGAAAQADLLQTTQAQVTAQGAALQALQGAVAGHTAALADLATDTLDLAAKLAAHMDDPDAHHSSTSAGLALTPASVAIQGSDTALLAQGLALAPGEAGQLTADKLAKLVGGPDVLADDLHTHAGLQGGVGGGGCYTAYGTSACGTGYTAMYSGTVAFPAAVNGSNVAIGGSLCMSGWSHTGNFSNLGIGFANGTSYWEWATYNRVDTSAKPCAVCCPAPKSGAIAGCTQSLDLGQAAYGTNLYWYGTPPSLTLGYAGFNYRVHRITLYVYRAGSWFNNQVPNFRLRVTDSADKVLKVASVRTISDPVSTGSTSFIEVESILDLDLPGGTVKAEVVTLDGQPWSIWAHNNNSAYYYRFHGCLLE